MRLSHLRTLLRPSLVSPARGDAPCRTPTVTSSSAATAVSCASSASLADQPVGQPCRIASVDAPAAAPEWSRWLAEIGFLPGEPARVTARSPWGDGGLVVRIGSSNFALRHAEARCVSVRKP